MDIASGVDFQATYSRGGEAEREGCLLEGNKSYHGMF